jgi:hypothetical protein
MIVNDYSAELVVAGTFADAGWNVYFPHRDKGFDFIITKDIEGIGELIRPVQVKGKYPTGDKMDKATYGYVGKLTKLHPQMVLAMPFYNSNSVILPNFIAYLPISMIKKCSRGYRCQPATFKNGEPIKRPFYAKFFDMEGLTLLENVNWNDIKL